MADDGRELGHLLDVESIANSVLRGVKAISLCGEVRELTRDDFPADLKPLCPECMALAAKAHDGEVKLNPLLTWLDVLERAYLSADRPVITITEIGGKYTWPPAA